MGYSCEPKEASSVLRSHSYSLVHTPSLWQYPNGNLFVKVIMADCHQGKVPGQLSLLTPGLEFLLRRRWCHTLPLPWVREWWGGDAGEDQAEHKPKRHFHWAHLVSPMSKSSEDFCSKIGKKKWTGHQWLQHKEKGLSLRVWKSLHC